MTSGPQSEGARPVSLPLIAGVVAVLVLIAGWMFYAQFIKPSQLPPQTNPEKYTVWLQQKAKEAGGDYDKLSAKDRAEVDMRTMGHGRQALRAAYEKAQGAKP